MRTQDFDFYLPDQLIAQHPSKTRTASRLLRLDGSSGEMQDDQFDNLLNHLNPNDLLVLNNTKVIKARLYGQKATGGAVEVMVERIMVDNQALVYIKASRAPKTDARIHITDDIAVKVLGREDNLFHVVFEAQQDVLTILETHGHLPLPPYIKHAADESDESRYQTVFAKHAGAVAAPTAGLHFTDAMLEKIKAKGVGVTYITLHVGAGTFQPVKVDNIHEHKMHSERYEINEETVAAIKETQANQGKVIAVGTTVLRTLESAAQAGSLVAQQNETDIFIYPGFAFKVVDTLITNFHLPKSTLLMLVSAFGGTEHIKAAYAHAVEQEYRFFSYGDAMMISKQTQ